MIENIYDAPSDVYLEESVNGGAGSRVAKYSHLVKIRVRFYLRNLICNECGALYNWISRERGTYTSMWSTTDKKDRVTRPYAW